MGRVVKTGAFLSQRRLGGRDFILKKLNSPGFSDRSLNCAAAGIQPARRMMTISFFIARGLNEVKFTKFFLNWQLAIHAYAITFAKATAIEESFGR